MIPDFLDDLEFPGVSEDKQYRFWESWSRPLGPRPMQIMISFVFWTMKLKSYELKMKQNNSTEVLCNSFNKIDS